MFQVAVAVVLAMGRTKQYLLAHPDNFWVFPKLARWTLGKTEIWFDLGLFTDPLLDWLPARMAIIFAIGCAVYTAGCLPFDALRYARRLMTIEADRRLPSADSATEDSSDLEFPPTHIPTWFIVTVIVIALLILLLQPAVD